jgi:hypothetical protein
MRKDNVDVVAFWLSATVPVELEALLEKIDSLCRWGEHIPASDGTDTTGLHGVEMVHDRGMYGFNFIARYAVMCVSTKVWA